MLRKIQNIIWLLLFICYLSGSNNIITAQDGGKLAGKVVDAATGNPLPGVNILIQDTNLGAVTDAEGDYYVLNVPPGTYSIRASMVGFKNVIQTNVKISVNHTTELDFKLEETVVEIGEDVVIISERRLVEQDETSTRHFVSATEIASRPTDELTQVLNTLPGIDVNTGGELVVRRGSINQVAFLIDGIRARNPVDFQPYTNINLTSIQELEIITGGFNAEYGEAQSGVFNIITKDGSKNIESYSEFRYTPPGKYHWGTEFYDYSSDKFWENSNARHLQWWIDHPDQWVDPNGVRGNDPASIWTPEQAYQDYIQTHRPLNDYTNQAGYQAEISLGGPLPLNNLFFFFSGKYRTAPPITGNSFRDRGSWYDGTLKLTYNLSRAIKLMASGFFSEANTGYGMESLELETGLENKYAYYDYPGYPVLRIDGQTLKATHVLNPKTYYELQLSRVYTYRSQGVFPNDPNGWEQGAPINDRLRAVDENGNPIIGGYNNIIGLHTTGYYYRGEDRNTDLTLSGDITSQLSKTWQFKGGFDLTYYTLDRYQEGKAYEIIEDKVYNPFEGNAYIQSKLEFEGLIMNLGLRYDFYNPNDDIYLNPFDPLDNIGSEQEGREPNPLTKKTIISSQFSPRIGISHPISENTVLHFSYGHFFQRAEFGNYGEGTGTEDENQRVTGILNTYLVNPISGNLTPYNLGNRELDPRKTVAYELGIEHNFAGIVADVTAFYKDITNTIRTVRVFMSNGASYLTTGNSDYADAKGVEVQIRRPLIGLWGGYLNYSWSTGIAGRSGDPDVIAAPGSGVQTRVVNAIGDEIQYDPARLKFGITVATPGDLSFAGGIFSDIQLSLDYQIYYPHKQINSDNFLEGGRAYIRYADKNADLRIRKEIDVLGVRPALFVEIHNVFNDKWVNLETVSSASPEDKVRFINSRFEDFPDRDSDGGPFPDVIQYRNLPRRIVFGFAFGL